MLLLKNFKLNKITKRLIIILLLLVPIIISLCTRNPKGTSHSGQYHEVENLKIIYDLSYQSKGQTKREHNILNETLEVIANADEYLILDLFLFNDEYNEENITYPNSVEKITDALIAKKTDEPQMPIIFITDPINNFYGAYEQKHITRLKDSGIQVVITDLNKMKDSNTLFSGYYRCYMQWIPTRGGGWITNFFDKNAEKVNLRSILKLANLKANHRKVVLSEKEAIVSSANPHDASSYHSNIAVRFSGNAIEDLMQTELAVISFSGGTLPDITYKKQQISGSNSIRIITEREIFNALADNINRTQKGDEIWIGIFYISDFDILSYLGEASDRGVDVKIIADPNKDAFGIKKNGSPNRSALCSLAKKHKNLQVRWYATNGEQYHVKAALFNYNADKKSHIILGSANFTRRNLKGYNLETDVEIVTPIQSTHALEMKKYFNKLWTNQGGTYTVPINTYYEDSMLHNIMWRLQEISGLCSW